MRQKISMIIVNDEDETEEIILDKKEKKGFEIIKIFLNFARDFKLNR